MRLLLSLAAALCLAAGASAGTGPAGTVTIVKLSGGQTVAVDDGGPPVDACPSAGYSAGYGSAVTLFNLGTAHAAYGYGGVGLARSTTVVNLNSVSHSHAGLGRNRGRQRGGKTNIKIIQRR